MPEVHRQPCAHGSSLEYQPHVVQLGCHLGSFCGLSFLFMCGTRKLHVLVALCRYLLVLVLCRTVHGRRFYRLRFIETASFVHYSPLFPFLLLSFFYPFKMICLLSHTYECSPNKAVHPRLLAAANTPSLSDQGQMTARRPCAHPTKGPRVPRGYLCRPSRQRAASGSP